MALDDQTSTEKILHSQRAADLFNIHPFIFILAHVDIDGDDGADSAYSPPTLFRPQKNVTVFSHGKSILNYLNQR